MLSRPPLDLDHSTPKIVADAPQVKRGREELLLLHIASESIFGLKNKWDEENDAAGFSLAFPQMRHFFVLMRQTPD